MITFDATSGMVPVGTMSQRVSDWCRRRLGSPAVETLRSTGHLSVVRVVRLADDRRVVVKIRPAQDRLAGCAAVQRHLWRAGFPCPEPLAGPHPFGVEAASAEVAIDPAGVGPGPDAEAASGLLAELIRLAPDPDTVPSLAPAPAWSWWYHEAGAVWPPPDDRDEDLNAYPETAWLDELGTHVRRRLAIVRGAVPVIGHCDFEAQNIWWRDGRPLAVHDWDSAVCEPEPVIVGLAAAVWPAGAATIEQSAAFLDGYQRAAGRLWSTEEVEASWAAGLWVRTFNAKKASLDGSGGLAGLGGLARLDREEAADRGRRAGIRYSPRS